VRHYGVAVAGVLEVWVPAGKRKRKAECLNDATLLLS
jgi:hypothetical protein